MGDVHVHDKTFELFISHDEILKAIEAVCKRLDEDYTGRQEPPMLLCTLNGALPFTAEVMQRVSFDHVLVCMKVSSYDGMQSAGAIKSILGPTSDIKGKDVIILEDIVDTGVTIVQMRKLLLENFGAASVKVCSLLYKPANFSKCLTAMGMDVKENEPEYYAMTVPDDFILGFGLDYDQLGRQYPDIYRLKRQ